MVYRDDDRYQVIGFTATQIPNIADRRHPADLRGPLYPTGIPILPEEDLAALIDRFDARQVVFSYADVSYDHVMHRAAVADAADLVLLGQGATMLESPVAVVRHPMPYGDLSAQRVQRFATVSDLARDGCTIEEMEEYEPHLENGTVVWAGVDYAAPSSMRLNAT